MHRYAADHDSAGGGELRVHAIWGDSGGCGVVRWVSAGAELEYAAATAVRRHAAVFARGGRGSRYHRDVCAGEFAELVWQLGSDLRKAWISSAGSQRVCSFDVHCARGDGNRTAGVCVEIRAQARASAVCALGGAGIGSAAKDGSAGGGSRGGEFDGGGW